jgi:hypothetical protein
MQRPVFTQDGICPWFPVDGAQAALGNVTAAPVLVDVLEVGDERAVVVVVRALLLTDNR